MKNPDALSGLFLFFLSIGACMMAHRLGLGSGTNPGPGFAAFGIASLLGLMSLFLCFKGVLQSIRDRGKTEPVQGLPSKKPMFILVILVGYGAFFKYLGFSVSTFLLMMSLVWVVGRQRLRLALVVSFLTVACAYLLFVVALGLQLPAGPFGHLFGD